jgi:hypothetical protein
MVFRVSLCRDRADRANDLAEPGATPQLAPVSLGDQGAALEHGVQISTFFLQNTCMTSARRVYTTTRIR